MLRCLILVMMGLWLAACGVLKSNLMSQLPDFIEPVEFLYSGTLFCNYEIFKADVIDSSFFVKGENISDYQSNIILDFKSCFDDREFFNKYFFDCKFQFWSNESNSVGVAYCPIDSMTFVLAGE